MAYSTGSRVITQSAVGTFDGPSFLPHADFLFNQGAYLIRIHPSSSDLVNKCWVLRVFSCPVQNNHPPFLFFFFPTQKNEWFSIGLYCILNRLRTVIQITTCLDCDIFPPHWVPFSLHWHENTGWKVHSIKKQWSSFSPPVKSLKRREAALAHI